MLELNVSFFLEARNGDNIEVFCETYFSTFPTILLIIDNDKFYFLFEITVYNFQFLLALLPSVIIVTDIPEKRKPW